jgi:hypothetical protein
MKEDYEKEELLQIWNSLEKVIFEVAIDDKPSP